MDEAPSAPSEPAAKVVPISTKGKTVESKYEGFVYLMSLTPPASKEAKKMLWDKLSPEDKERLNKEYKTNFETELAGGRKKRGKKTRGKKTKQSRRTKRRITRRR